MTPSERVVAALCQQTFLSFWSFPNPKRADNKKELCDLLVVNKPYILIFSVKEIEIKDSGDNTVDTKRWKSRAFDKSFDQLYGAERALKNRVEVLTSDYQNKIEIENIEDYSFYRIAISIGRKDKFPLLFGDFGKGFIHTFDEISSLIILQELDTITDFVQYLNDKEAFYKLDKHIMTDGEENILAMYLHNGRKFPDDFDILQIMPDIWNEFIKKEEYIRKKESDRESYIWDSIIEEFYDRHIPNFLGINQGGTIEQSVRVLSKETRFSRRILSKNLLEVIGYYSEVKTRARMIKADSGIVYVFLIDGHREDNRGFRMKELALRCFVARGKNKECSIIIGLATNPYIKGGGHSYDLYYLERPTWTEEDEKNMLKIQDDLGYFKNPQMAHFHDDEYPNSPA